MKTILLFLGLGGLTVGTVWPSGSAPLPKPRTSIDYAQVDRLFRLYDCVDCHSASSHPSAGLNLTTPDAILKGGKRGAVVKPGDSEHSLLMELVPGRPGRMMPPEGRPLKPEEVQIIKTWIDEGANTSDYGRAMTRYYAAEKESNWSQALKACLEIGDMKIPGCPTTEVSIKIRLPILAQMKDEKGWYSAARKAVGFRPLNAGMLNVIAWTIVDPQGWVMRKDADLAIKAASLAVKDSGRHSGQILDTLAWAYFVKGDQAKAIETENEAIQCKDATGDVLKGLQDDLRVFSG